MPRLASPRGASLARICEVAEQHFSARGYAGVTLKEIADALSIRQPSLYHHVPGGKEALYVEVMLRACERHRIALFAVAGDQASPLAERLGRMAAWVLRQPAMDINRMMLADMPQLAPRHQRRLEEAIRSSLLAPVEQVLRDARSPLRQPLRACAGAYWALIQSLAAVKRVAPIPDEILIAQTIDLALHGILGESNDH